jgi:thiol:disulfide interchange protein
MLWTLFTVLMTLWLVGVIKDETLGGFLHLLLFLAALVLVTELGLRYRQRRLH